MAGYYHSAIRSVNWQWWVVFVQINEIEHRMHCAWREADFDEALVQPLRTGIAPAALDHVRVSDWPSLVAQLVHQTAKGDSLVRPINRHHRLEWEGNRRHRGRRPAA